MPRPAPIVEPDDVDLMIIEHAGDIRAALAASMAEAAELREEITFASLAMSFGFARGWKPKASTDGPTEG